MMVLKKPEGQHKNISYSVGEEELIMAETSSQIPLPDSFIKGNKYAMWFYTKFLASVHMNDYGNTS